MKKHNILLYGFHLLFLAFGVYLLQLIFFILKMREGFILFSITNILFLISVFMILVDTIISFFPSRPKSLKFDEIKDIQIAVAMTAYNDELSIKNAVKDFINRDSVERVVVIDNNSIDKTAEEAKNAGAIVVREEIQGYGACCIRALKEAMKYGDIICLVEGDCTFSGSDLKKLTSYLENADMVTGTRTTKELNTPDSQMNFSLQWGNFLMAKLLQLKFWSVRLTDMGCTYRVIRRPALEKIMDRLTVKGNHFLCEMTLAALNENLMVIEIPVTFKKRIGISKGVGGNFFKAAFTALNMWKLILFR